MEFFVQSDGLMTERSIQELAAWYAGDDPGREDFEAHLLMLRAYNSLISSAQRGRRTPMSLERYALMRSIYRAPAQRLQMGEMGRMLGVSPTSITKLVDSLVRLGYVRRVPHEVDKRRTWVELTPRGAALVEDRLPGVKQSTLDRWKGLTNDEKRMLSHLLSKLILGTMRLEADGRVPSLRIEAGPVSSSTPD